MKNNEVADEKQLSNQEVQSNKEPEEFHRAASNESNRNHRDEEELKREVE